MKELPVSRQKKPFSVQKIKLICSFNGAFQPRLPYGKLRYVGGETRIISVDRNIGFLRLRSKISELHPLNPSFSLKYQLPESDGVDGDVSLVSVTTDEDVKCMIEEYDKLVSDGNPRRLWLFVCNKDNGYVGPEPNTDSSFTGLYSEIGNPNVGTTVVGREGKRGSWLPAETELSAPHLAGIQNSTHFFGPSVSLELSKIPVIQNVGIRSDDSLRKRVLEQQVMATQKAGCQSPRGFFMSKTSERERETPFLSSCSVGVQNSFNSLGEIVYQPQAPTNHPTTVNSFCNSYAMNVSNYNLQFSGIASQSFNSLNPSPESHMQSLKLNGGHAGLQGNSSIQFLPSRFGEVFPNEGGLNAGSSSQSVATIQFLKQSHSPRAVSGSAGIDFKGGPQNIKRVPMGTLSGGNVSPWTTGCNSVETCATPVSCDDQFVGGISSLKPSIANNRTWGNYQCGIRNHRFGAGDVRNQRINASYMRNNRGNLIEMVNRRAIDGKPNFWKCYPGLRPSSNISKHGQAVRSHLAHIWKPWSAALDHAREGMVWMMESSKDAQPSFNLKSSRGIMRALTLQPTDGRSPLDHVSRQGGLLATGYPNPPMDHLGYPGACHGLFYHHFQPLSLTKNPVPCLSNGKQTGNDSSKPKDPQKDIEITRCSIDRGNISGFKLRENSRCPMSDRKVQLDPNTSVKTLISSPDCTDISSGVHLSLDNLSLSSSKEVEPPTLLFSCAREHVLESSVRCEMDLLQNSSDAMDEGHLSSSQSNGKSNGNASNCSLKSPAAQSRKDLTLSELDQEDTSSSLNIDEKAELNGSHICSNVVGGICDDLAAIYTHLATQELQTIKNSDLEDIRELGSGTYGTVYYGKWKGSDVAIKRLKPSCFTGSEEDRLIADFWKEAHMLGQLHHPNVVAFYGVVTDGPAINLATVTEYMVNGSLKQVLQRKDRTIDRRKRLIIAMDAAFGMQYLHEKNVVHFDFKSHNLLVNMRDPHRPVCKIGDLGLSKIKQRTLVSGGVRGTIPWMAPELLTNKDKMVTEKVDVYSFGIVMWELLTGEEPYADMRSEKIIAGIIKGDLRPEVPSWCEPAWRSLMERCWSSDPELRPGFPEIAKELRAMSVAMNIK
ncbi:hypothetical protein NE237_029044 [Protea cynaroides]|uniref:Protein kinase domain-containing protein n=1 Tax=Protea cynaroides TaxID=273540 RepID=A0A9Q0GUI3_9MAGN|nr:hypothetical protein NE237_029044 [Protea cynaroides]